MNRKLLIILLLFSILCGLAVADAQSPFFRGKKQERVTAAPAPMGPVLAKLVLWQHELKQKMTGLIRQAKEDRNIRPLLYVLAIAFGYGLIHAAGPGHGKALAMAFVLSRNPGVAAGAFFGILVAFCHGMSGALCVFAIKFILNQGVMGTLGSVTRTTQIVSYALIVLLGMGILIKSGYELLRRPAPDTPAKESHRPLLPWALAVGLVPCPGVVMVLLFCLSMDLMVLGLLLTAVISLGMAVTISLVVLIVVMGKSRTKHMIAPRWHRVAETLIGVASGILLTFFGSLFFMISIS